MTKKTVCTLEEAVNYDNDDVVHRFVGIFDMPFEDAKQIFHETKKWIWLAAIAEEERSIKLLMDKDLVWIDEMWHNFILFTKAYDDYCATKFGFYVHHRPTPHKEKLHLESEIATNPSIAENLIKMCERKYSYIYDKLGEETLRLWYATMCYKYTSSYLLSIRKK